MVAFGRPPIGAVYTFKPELHMSTPLHEQATIPNCEHALKRRLPCRSLLQRLLNQKSRALYLSPRGRATVSCPAAAGLAHDCTVAAGK
jgi:hypothetical protein